MARRGHSSSIGSLAGRFSASDRYWPCNRFAPSGGDLAGRQLHAPLPGHQAATRILLSSSNARWVARSGATHMARNVSRKASQIIP